MKTLLEQIAEERELKLQHDNREDAEKVANIINQNAKPTKMCPLVKSFCVKDCVCWREAFVMEKTGFVAEGKFKNVRTFFKVSGFKCGNMMFFGCCIADSFPE